MDKRLKVNFVPFSNFGDTSVPYMLKKLQIPFIFTHHTVEKKILMTGSIIGVGAKKDTIVWGSGIIDNNIIPNKDAIYLAVRGPRTLEKLRKNGIDTSSIAIGDPAMLLSKIYKPNLNKKYKLGVIPHMVDYAQVKKYIMDNQKDFLNTIIIDPNTNTKQIENFIDQVNQCQKIVATCLHGIICAHSYNIPAKWMKISNKLAGDDIKFYDHFESMGIYDLKPITTIYNENIEIPDFTCSLDLEKLWAARPWVSISNDCYVDIHDPEWISQCYYKGYEDRIWTDNYF